MIHADIRTSILITMGLVFIAQVFFNPVLLSAIFALILLCLFFSLKDQSKAVAKMWTFFVRAKCLSFAHAAANPENTPHSAYPRIISGKTLFSARRGRL